MMVVGDNGGWLWVVLAGWFAGGLANGIIRPAIASAAAAALGSIAGARRLLRRGEAEVLTAPEPRAAPAAPASASR